jgi:hypothetical protein
MNGVSCIAMAALILLLLPIVVLPWEGRRPPGALYAAIAGGGVVLAGLQGGASGAGWAVASGVVMLAAVAGGVTVLRLTRNLQLLTSGHIRLLAAGAAWLGPVGALAMAGIAFAALFAAAALHHLRSTARRPDFPLIAAAAILAVSLVQAARSPAGNPMFLASADIHHGE